MKISGIKDEENVCIVLFCLDRIPLVTIRLM